MEPTPEWYVNDNAGFKIAAAAVKSIVNLVNITQARYRAECDVWRTENSPFKWA